MVATMGTKARAMARAVATAAGDALVTLEPRGRVAVLRLNDPRRLNPMTDAMGAALQGS